MASMIRIPINNVLMESLYTLKIQVGSAAVPINVLPDTGSSMLAIAGSAYHFADDRNARTTNLLQTAQFSSGSFTAAVVRTSVGIGNGAPPNEVTLQGANLAVTYQVQPGTFGNADGIFGLAYGTLDTAWQMPADTWQNHYNADQVSLGRTADLDPYFSQLAEAGLVSGKFAFAVRRSIMRSAQPHPAQDPLNQGVFVLGGGEECHELYTGAFDNVAVVHEKFYNTNLLAIQVGDHTVNVPPPAPGAQVASNSIVDNGNATLKLDQGLYDKIVALFGPELAALLKAGSPDVGGCEQTRIDFGKWPTLCLILQGSDAGQAKVIVKPADYWQFDSGQPGTATTALCGDGGMLAGQSNLGLPVFSGHYVVFDRTASSGHGVIRFANRAL
jgi:hypothetical protein